MAKTTATTNLAGKTVNKQRMTLITCPQMMYATGIDTKIWIKSFPVAYINPIDTVKALTVPVSEGHSINGRVPITSGAQCTKEGSSLHQYVSEVCNFYS